MTAHDADIRPAPTLTARDVAELVDGELRGPGERTLRGLAPLDQAGPDELGLLAMRRYLDQVPNSGAGALLVAEELADAAGERDGAPEVFIVVPDPHRVLPTLLRRFHPPRQPEPGVHPTAVLGPGIELGESVSVGPYAVLREGVVVGDEARIGAHVVVGRDVRIGRESVLHPMVVLYAGSILGDRVVLHAGVAVGVDGFGYVTVDGEHLKVPQVGRCVVGDDVEIGANVTLDRGSIGESRVGRGSKLDNLVHLGHNVHVGPDSLLVAQVGVAGSTRLGRGVRCAGQSGIAGHLHVGDGVRVAAKSAVLRDVDAGATVAGFPARDRMEFFRGRALVRKLPELRERIRTLEARIKALEERSGGDR